MVTRLFVDVQNRKLLESAGSTAPTNLPAVYREDNWRLVLSPLSPTENIATPYAPADAAAYSLRVAIGTAAAQLAFTDAAGWTWDAASKSWSGAIDLDTPALAAALSGVDSINSELELEVEGPTPGLFLTLFQGKITINNDIIQHP